VVGPASSDAGLSFWEEDEEVKAPSTELQRPVKHQDSISNDQKLRKAGGSGIVRAFVGTDLSSQYLGKWSEIGLGACVLGYSLELASWVLGASFPAAGKKRLTLPQN